MAAIHLPVRESVIEPAIQAMAITETAERENFKAGDIGPA
jgi:hypothetical protein